MKGDAETGSATDAETGSATDADIDSATRDGSAGDSDRDSNGDSDTDGAPPTPDRYFAVVSALLDVRTDLASARFDSEVDAALAANRIDAPTARALRWWQRASVRAAESYAATVLPAVLTARAGADADAATEADEVAASWKQAHVIATATIATTNSEAATNTTSDAGPPSAPAATAIRWNHPTRLIVVPDLGVEPERTARSEAVKAAFRSTGPAGATVPTVPAVPTVRAAPVAPTVPTAPVAPAARTTTSKRKGPARP